MRILSCFSSPLRYGAIALLLNTLTGGLSVAAETIRVVALGDSLTAGYGLPQEEGLTAQLETWLHENGAPDAVVANAGVSGDTTAGGRARLDWALAEGGDALIVALGGNDLLRAIDPAESRANLTWIMEEAERRNLPSLLIGMRAPLNYGPEYKADFDAIYPDLAAAHGALYEENFLEGVIGGAELMQGDGIHPNAAGVAAIVERLGPLVLELVERARADG